MRRKEEGEEGRSRVMALSRTAYLKVMTSPRNACL
jgi:hypothetical protein